MSECMYILEEHKDEMFEFFAILSALQESDRYKDICPKEGFVPNSKVSDAYYRLALANKRWNTGLGMFFVKKPERDMNLFDWIFRADIDMYNSGEDLIKTIEAIPPRDMIFKALKFNDVYNNFSDKFYEEIIDNRGVFMSYMNGLNASTEIRWDIMSFIQNPEEIAANLKEYIQKMYNEFSLEYANLKEETAALRETVRFAVADESIDAAIVEFEASKHNTAASKLQLLSQNAVPPTNEARVAALLFAPNKLGRVDTMRNTYYTVGVGYMEYFERNVSTEGNNAKLKDIFKAFTDPTRSQIIELLHEKECYNGELSKLLGVPMSSLTHHMEILNTSGFVSKRIEGKRTYYKINKKQFIYAANLLRKYVENED